MGVTRSLVALWVVVALLAFGAVVGPGAGSEAGPFATSTQIETDSVGLSATLDGDGSAVWQIEHRVGLDDENASRAFETLQADIRANRSAFESRFAERMRSTVLAAENATGREMAIGNVSVTTTTTPANDGLVRYAFEWDGFAAVDGERIRAGDAVAGLYLDPDQTLQFEWPERYGVVSVEPAADEVRRGIAVWGGQKAFASDEPRVVLSTSATPSEGGGDSAGPGGPTATTPPDSSPAGRSDLSPFLLAGLLAAVLVVGGGVWLFVTGEREGLPGVATSGDGVGDAPVAGEDGDSGTDDGEPAEAGATPPEELLSNEERVLHLLEEHGGRMKQQDVVSELDWTDAKTSQVVGTLREEDQIEVFRIGRENVLALPGESDL